MSAPVIYLGRERPAPPGAARDATLLGLLIALVYLVGRPPIYERDGYVYHLEGRDFVGGINPHHLLWNAVQWLVGQASALLHLHSTILWQLVGMAAEALAAVLLYRLLRFVGAGRAFAFVASLFTALAPWTWFMAFQNQPYALMFLLVVLFLTAFATADGGVPRGWRFAGAAVAAVGMVMLQQAAVLIVVAVTLVFLVLGGWKRALGWALATGLPTAALYILFAWIDDVEDVPEFRAWLTEYLQTQHALQVKMPDFVAKSVMGLISTFVNQDLFKERVVDVWPGRTILWFYLGLGIVLVLLLVWALRRARIRRLSTFAHADRALVWTSVASIVSWGVFCFLWEPTNYYWYVLLAPFFVWVVAVLHPAPRTEAAVAVVLLLATGWNLYADHLQDAAGATRNPEPQVAVIHRHMTAADLLWVVDLGWRDDVDYDLLQSVGIADSSYAIASVSEVAGRARSDSAWQQTVLDSTDHVMQRGGKVFLSDRVYDPDAYDRSWENSPFADYTAPRTARVNWSALSTNLPALIAAHYNIQPGFAIGSDSIWRLVPRSAK